MWWLITIIFFLISVVSSTILYFALKRITQYEEFLLQIQQVTTFATEKLKLVDSKGHYESDDETGFFFNELKELQGLLDGLFETEKIDTETKNAKKKK